MICGTGTVSGIFSSSFTGSDLGGVFPGERNPPEDEDQDADDDQDQSDDGLRFHGRVRVRCSRRACA